MDVREKNVRGWIKSTFCDTRQSILRYCFRPCPITGEDTIYCPCDKCTNRYIGTRDKVLRHLYYNGFKANYNVWRLHSEDDNFIQVENEMPSFSHCEEHVGEFRDLFVVVADGHVGPSAQSQQGHPGSSWRSNDPNLEAKAFYDWLDNEQESLYGGCDSVSSLKATATLLHIKSSRSIFGLAFDDICAAFKRWLPDDNKLPGTFDESKKSMKSLGLKFETIYACQNDCMLYYKETARLTVCSTCNLSRYAHNEGGSTSKRVPRKVLRYLPIIPRLQRLFMSRKTIEYMTWHKFHPLPVGSMTHPSHGHAWRHFDETFPDFASDPRNVRLGLCADEFSPFGYSVKSYSIWPVILTVYNLPPWLCMTRPFLFVTLLIPGPNSPGQNIDVYIHPLVDDLKLLWEEGVQTWDVMRRQNFHLRAALLWTIGDFPAYGMLSGWSTHGKLACPYCMRHTKSFRLKFSGKATWFDCHRRFLIPSHQFRHQRNSFFTGRVEIDGPPPMLSAFDIKAKVDCLPPNRYGLFLKSNERHLGFGVSHNWHKRSSFWELPYWKHLLVRHVLDVIHIEKNFFDNIFFTILASKDKRNKDDAKGRKDLALHCSCKSLELVPDGHRVMMPKASYSLIRNDVSLVCNWLKKLKFLDGYVSNISNCVNTTECTITGLKSHDCHVRMQRVLPVALRDFIPPGLWHAIAEL